MTTHNKISNYCGIKQLVNKNQWELGMKMCNDGRKPNETELMKKQNQSDSIAKSMELGTIDFLPPYGIILTAFGVGQCAKGRWAAYCVGVFVSLLLAFPAFSQTTQTQCTSEQIQSFSTQCDQWGVSWLAYEAYCVSVSPDHYFCGYHSLLGVRPIASGGLGCVGKWVKPPSSAGNSTPSPQFAYALTLACSIPSDLPSPPKNAGNGCNDLGNPINIGVGNKHQHELDYAGIGEHPLRMERAYNGNAKAPNNFSVGWNTSYDREIFFETNGLNGVERNSIVTISRADGKQYQFTQTGTNNSWVGDADAVGILVQQGTNATGNPSGWTYTTDQGDVETYNTSGKLTTIANRAGLTQTLSYNCTMVNSSCPTITPSNIAPSVAGLLLSVTDFAGRQISFTYDGSARVVKMIDPAGGIYSYAYNGAAPGANLTSVTYPDGTSKTYHYENTVFPHALTGITDENGKRFATYSYDAQGRAIATEHAGGADRVSLAYNADGSTTVTDALGTARTYQFQTILGVVKPKGQSQPGGSGCGASASALSYDANGNVTSRTDFNGSRTDYSYDLARNLETSRTEGLTASGATTPATRTITTVWHTTLRLPVQITNGNQQTTYAYNNQGDVIEKTIKDLATHTARTWTTTYTYGAVPGILLQKVEDGPRIDVSDLTTYDYYPADASCTGGHLGCRGQLQQVTDALGHRTTINRYNAYGQVEQLTNANGLVTTLSYEARQRLTSVDDGGETTTYSYDPAGQLTRVTHPDGSYLAYSYDAAHRLIQTQDNLGNTVTYTLDAIGNRIKEEAHDPSGQLARSQTRVYDALSRLQNLILPQ
jgi:YD repeat-containing protein